MVYDLFVTPDPLPAGQVLDTSTTTWQLWGRLLAVPR